LFDHGTFPLIGCGGSVPHLRRPRKMRRRRRVGGKMECLETRLTGPIFSQFARMSRKL
jgi:hypothetical protein